LLGNELIEGPVQCQFPASVLDRDFPEAGGADEGPVLAGFDQLAGIAAQPLAAVMNQINAWVSSSARVDMYKGYM
jgi:hypothetical protein